MRAVSLPSQPSLSRRCGHRIWLLLAVFVAGFVPHITVAQQQFLGVASCANGICHGATAPLANSAIQQDEYLIWHRQDQHARAYQTLFSSESQQIAERLKIGPAHEAAQCLNCHVSNPPAQQRGPKFLQSDGVGCESCHGPAEGWIDSHAEGYRSNQARLAAGLYPTWEPRARAELCSGCHLGSEDKPIDHQIMGAGHPPLRFEMDTYLASMPPHHRSDNAAELGKSVPSSMQNWLAGQLAGARVLLARLEQPQARGLLPDFMLFDCYACHHDLNEQRWQAWRAQGLRPGEPRLADQALVMLQWWLDANQPAQAQRWKQLRLELEWAVVGRGGTLPAAVAAAQHFVEQELSASAARVQSQSAMPVLKRALEFSATSFQGDFAVAEQIAMLAGVALQEQRAVVTQEQRQALTALHQSVISSRRFDQARYQRAAYQVKRLINNN